MSDLPANVNKFTDHFSSHVDLIHSLPRSQAWEVLQKSLYVAVIDSVGAIVFNEYRNNNGIRFRKTILGFAKWPHASHFSLPHLHQYLKVARDKFFERLAKLLINPMYETWIDTSHSRRDLPWIPLPGLRQVLSLDADVSQQRVFSVVNSSNAKKIKKIVKFQHCSLLYDYRNFLVHSLSVPGINNRPEAINYPYYEEYIGRDPGTGRAEIYYDLVYSSEFLYTLCERVIANAAGHMLAKGIDPYPRMQASTAFYWDHDLNQEIGEFGRQMMSTIRAHPGKWQRG